MKIFVNGVEQEIAENTTILSLVRSLSEDPRGMAIERNLEIVPKAEHGSTIIAEGDRLEVVQFVGGG